jgi:hypothetical protein
MSKVATVSNISSNLFARKTLSGPQKGASLSSGAEATNKAVFVSSFDHLSVTPQTRC